MSALARLRAEWRLKLGLTVVLNLFFWTGYGWLGRHALFPVRSLTLTFLDRAIPFQPQPWVAIYLSQFLLTGILPWLIDTREGVRRYTKGFAVISVMSFATFALFPVASPRPEGAGNVGGGMAWLLQLDGPFNAFPSLHAAFLVYMALLARHLFPKLPTVCLLAGAIWGGGILYATIATRQHYALDLAAGAFVGILADWLAWGKSSRSAASTTLRKRGVMSHEG